jgi:hypothetical protein
MIYLHVIAGGKDRRVGGWEQVPALLGSLGKSNVIPV